MHFLPQVYEFVSSLDGKVCDVDTSSIMISLSFSSLIFKIKNISMEKGH